MLGKGAMGLYVRKRSYGFKQFLVVYGRIISCANVYFFIFFIDRFELSSHYTSWKLFWQVSFCKDTLLKGVPNSVSFAFQQVLFFLTLVLQKNFQFFFSIYFFLPSQRSGRCNRAGGKRELEVKVVSKFHVPIFNSF